MIDMAEIRKEIKNLECGPTTFSNCEKLAMLYTILDHEKGMEMAEAYEQKERAKKTGWANMEYKPVVQPTAYHAKTAAPIDMEMVGVWMSGLENEDDTKGPHWTMEQTSQVAKQRNIDSDPTQFYAAMNAMYSDYCKVAKKHNVNSVDFYADMAKAFLADKDAADNKLALYYEYIVEH